MYQYFVKESAIIVFFVARFYCANTCPLLTVDWLILEFLTYRANAAGYMRYILKDVLRLMPVYGFIVNRHGGIFVRRRGGKDKEKIHDELKKMADQKRPVSVSTSVCCCTCTLVCAVVHVY